MRDGAPVVKSRLVVDRDAARMRGYLKARARGVSRAQSMRDTGIEAADSTAIGWEWNAMAYAGHTCWNQRYEIGAGGYVGGVKRRPRSEWVIQRNTHEALITDDEAEALIHALEHSSKASSRRTRADYLLSGVLRTPDGQAWHGDGEGFYRVGKGRRIKAEKVDQAVLEQIAEHLQDSAFISAYTKAARAQALAMRKDADLPRMRKELAELERQIARITELLGQTSMPDPLLRQIETHEQRRIALAEEVDRRSRAEADAEKVRALTAAHVARVMRAMRSDMAELDRDRLKDFLRAILTGAELDPAAGTLRLIYRLSAGDRVASPRIGQSVPGSLAWTSIEITRRAGFPR